MGQILSKHRISPGKSKLDLIRLTHRAKNLLLKVHQDFSSKLHPLYELLDNKTEWFWTKECEAAVIWAKEIHPNEQVLVH